MSRELLKQACTMLLFLPYSLSENKQARRDLLDRLNEELAKPDEGEIVVTKNLQGQIVAVTRQDEDGRILKVIDTSAKPEQEPVGSVVTWLGGSLVRWFVNPPPVGTLMYTAPPRKPWVGLTDDEILEFVAFEPYRLMNRTSIICAVQAKLKELNAVPTAQTGKEK